MPPVISVEHLSKVYRLGLIGTGTFSHDLEVWWAKVRGKPNPMLKIGETDHGNRDGEELWALRDVSFTVEQGQALGIIGRNGAGKSTLLKILSRVTAPTNGRVKVKGRIASLLEVGTGFHPELTGRENIFLNGAILGMTKSEINRKFDEIVDFSEVEKFIDTPVKRYSSGMYVRLAFAVAAHLEPEILIVDEVLAVGDAEFQKKCLGKMGDVAHEGRTVLFVSHNMGAVKALCVSAMLLDMGQKIYSGPVDDVATFYLRTFVSEAHSGKIAPSMHKDGSGELLINAVILENSTGQSITQVRINDLLTITIRFSIKERIQGVRIGLGFNTITGTRVATVHHTDEGLELFSGDVGVYEISLSLLNPLLPNTYILSAGAHRVLGGHTIDYVPEALKFDVAELSADGYKYERHNAGVIQLNGRWNLAKRIG